MRYLLPFFLIACSTLGIQSFANELQTHPQIQQWIQQLGDDSFLVRQRAETLLIHAGIQAHPELQRAKLSRDLEVVRRAEYILSQIEQTFLEMENRAVALWIRWYIDAPDQAFKARIIWALAVPTLDMTKGEGLHTLCRFVRFEENLSLRLEAVKTLIAHPPVSPLRRQQWYQYIRDNFHETDANELFQCLARYAKLWCELDEAPEKTIAEFQERVRNVGAETLRLLERPENNVQAGSTVDIMLHYAIAELQDAAGLIEDRDATVATALATQPEPIQAIEPIQPIGNNDNLFMYEHYDAGSCLQLRFRLHWALAHFQKVIETGDIRLRIPASERAAEAALYFADYPAAVAFYDKQIELLNSPEYRRGHDPTRQIANARKQKAYCLAEQAAAEENWEEVRENVVQAWSIPDVPVKIQDINLVILAYRLTERHPDVVQEFKDKLESVLVQVWKSILAYSQGSPEEQLEKMPTACNAAAYLLATTGGDYPSALTLVESALKIEPDNASILDTLSHVYFLGDRIDEAIHTQGQVVRLAPEAIIFQQVLERFKRKLN